VNTNDLLNMLDDWDSANRRDEERFWEREKARMLADLEEDDDLLGPTNTRKESRPPQRRPGLFGRIFGRAEDRDEDR
jgi:hypothetical protein